MSLTLSQSSILDWLSQTSPDENQLVLTLPSTSISKPLIQSLHSSEPFTSPTHPSFTSPRSQKRKRAASDTFCEYRSKSCFSPPLPPPTHKLTKDALRQLTAQMAPNQMPITPTKSKVSGRTSSSYTPKVTGNIARLQESLCERGMHFNDTNAYESYPTLTHQVKEMLKNTRHSAASEKSVKAIGKYMADNETANEATLYPDLYDKILPHTHTVSSTKRSHDDTMKLIEQSYDDDDLHRVKDPNFVKHLIPVPEDLESDEKALGLKNPKPDYVYGKRPPKFPNKPIDEDLKALVGVCPDLRFAFLLMENVSIDKPIGEAIIQAQRGGAALVNAKRLLLGEGRPEGWKEAAGADLESIAFSCAWSPHIVMLFVHWCEARDNEDPIFHMNRLGRYVLIGGEDAISLRHDVHNIWDWGLLNSVPAAEKALDKIVEARAERKRIAKAQRLQGTYNS